jgi:hypothetical protein
VLLTLLEQRLLIPLVFEEIEMDRTGIVRHLLVEEPARNAA